MNSKVPQVSLVGKDDMKKTNGVGNRKSKYDNNKETRLGQPAQKKKNKSNGKKSQKKRVILETVLSVLPTPCPSHLASLSAFLTRISVNYGMSEEDLHRRCRVFHNVKNLLDERIIGSHLRLFGSSKTGLGLKTSDINIYVTENSEEAVPNIFIAILNVLKSSDQCCEIKEEFESALPAINFKDTVSGLWCRISTGTNVGYNTTSLLNLYGELDGRVKILCHCFRLWAKVCKVDRQEMGLLPSYSFILMVIHYLQQVEPPVLPVVHELIKKIDDDPIIYFDEKYSDHLKIIRSSWKSRNAMNVGELWLGLLRFYSDYEKNEVNVINIRQTRRLPRSELSWGRRKFAIEDPFSRKNVARLLANSEAYQFIVEHLRVALLYFGRHPNDKNSELQLKANAATDGKEVLAKTSTQRSTDKCGVGKKCKDPKPEHKPGEDAIDTPLDEDDDCVDGDCGDETFTKGRNELALQWSVDGLTDHGNDDDLVSGIFAIDTINDSEITVNSDDDTVNTSAVKETNDASSCIALRNHDGPAGIVDNGTDWPNAEYLFDESVLRKGEALNVVGNLTEEDITRTLEPLPPFPRWFEDILTNVCLCCKDDYGITDEDVKRRTHFLRRLENHIRRNIPDAKLHLFGSSCNGFGFAVSDMDVCMTLEGKAKTEIDSIHYIRRLASILRDNRDYSNVITIVGAKVPIVKFVLKPARLEADISMYNEVALWNTRLLATYVQIDPRVRILGCALKVFVKLCDIGDASKGSLSSYAYILMLLHYLQQREPPVIPVLQELHDTPQQPKFVVEGHNCWFYDNLDGLKKKWTSNNDESCGLLWLGFLRYYTEEFDYRRNVVCVRHLKTLTKFEKMWNGRQICIEDPFVLSHNLGAGLSLAMVKFIRSTFERARVRFGTARDDIPREVYARQSFFFQPEYHTNGMLPPTDRNCNICGKIGHFAKTCPFNMKAQRGNVKQKKNGKGNQNKTTGTNDQKNAENVDTKKETADPIKTDEDAKDGEVLRSDVLQNNSDNRKGENNEIEKVEMVVEKKSSSATPTQDCIVQKPSNTSCEKGLQGGINVRNSSPKQALTTTGLPPHPNAPFSFSPPGLFPTPLPNMNWSYQPLSPPASPANVMSPGKSTSPLVQRPPQADMTGTYPIRFARMPPASLMRSPPPVTHRLPSADVVGGCQTRNDVIRSLPPMQLPHPAVQRLPQSEAVTRYPLHVGNILPTSPMRATTPVIQRLPEMGSRFPIHTSPLQTPHRGTHPLPQADDIDGGRLILDNNLPSVRLPNYQSPPNRIPVSPAVGSHVRQLFVAPSNPFPLNFFQRNPNMFLANSPRMAGPLYGQHMAALSFSPPGSRAPRVISCQELESGIDELRLSEQRTNLPTQRIPPRIDMDFENPSSVKSSLSDAHQSFMFGEMMPCKETIVKETMPGPTKLLGESHNYNERISDPSSSISKEDNCSEKNCDSHPSRMVQNSSNDSAITSTPNDVNSTPNEVKSTPNDVNSTSNDVKSTPNDVNSTSNEVKSTPNDVNSTSNDVKSTPNEVNAPPDTEVVVFNGDGKRRRQRNRSRSKRSKQHTDEGVSPAKEVTDNSCDKNLGRPEKVGSSLQPLTEQDKVSESGTVSLNNCIDTENVEHEELKNVKTNTNELKNNEHKRHLGRQYRKIWHQRPDQTNRALTGNKSSSIKNEQQVFKMTKIEQQEQSKVAERARISQRNEFQHGMKTTNRESTVNNDIFVNVCGERREVSVKSPMSNDGQKQRQRRRRQKPRQEVKIASQV